MVLIVDGDHKDITVFDIRFSPHYFRALVVKICMTVLQKLMIVHEVAEDVEQHQQSRGYHQVQGGH
jgi:hypothetical protein